MPHRVREDGQLDAVVEAVSADDDPEVMLVQALAKGGRDEQAIENAVELGVTAVMPWAAERSIVQWRGPKVDKARLRGDRSVLAAAKQSRRALVPRVEPLATTQELAGTGERDHSVGHTSGGFARSRNVTPRIAGVARRAPARLGDRWARGRHLGQ